MAFFGLPKCNQALLARVVRIHALLRDGRRFTAADLMKEFEADVRAVRRAFQFMRDSLGAPVGFDPRIQSYIYTREYLHLPSMCVTADERLVMKLIQQTFPRHIDSRINAAATTLLRKFIFSTGGDGDVAPLEDVVLPAAVLGAAELAHLPDIHEAISRRRELQIDYLKTGATQSERHVIQPHRLRFYKDWIVLAHDVTRGGEQRIFVLKRMQAAQVTKTTFTRPKGFDPDKILEGNIGAYTGTEDHLVRIRLRHSAAQAALDRPWHASQTVARQPDGSLEMTVRLNNLVEVKNEILACGANAEVLAPAALREAMHQILLAAAAQYAHDPAASAS